MDKSLKKKILIATIIASIAIVFVPIYFFVFADSGDDGHYTVTYKKIVAMEDGSGTFDANNEVGNDSSEYNSRVRTFDKITYTVSHTLNKNVESASNDVDGRELLVEVLIPTSYTGTIKYTEEAYITVKPGAQGITILNKEGTDFYRAAFNVPVGELGVNSNFVFSFEDINTDDIATHNSIQPLVFIKESTDDNTPSAANAALSDAVTCEIPAVTDPTTEEVIRPALSNYGYAVTLTGKEDYFVNLYAGTRKTNEDDITTIPIGIMVGLQNQPNGKGIKGLIVPNQLSFVISNSNTEKLAFVEDSLADYTPYQGTDDYKIEIAPSAEMPSITNGTVTGSINQSILNVTITDIQSHVLGSTNSFTYFASEYFKTQLAQRSEFDYTDISVTLTSNKSNSDSQQASITIVDSYNYVLGNYNSNIVLYDRDPEEGTSTNALPYGYANINYGSDYTFNVNFSYNSRISDSQGKGLTSLTNYVKIDNTALKLYENHSSNATHEFIANETISGPSIKRDIDQNGNYKVYFGFGEWSANYLEATNASGCPTIDFTNKEQLMNLYGGPCLVDKSTIQWAYSPVATDDINGQAITTGKGPMIVKSTFVTNLTNSGGYILPGAGGTLQLYGAVIDDYRVANNVYQITTSASAYGKNGNDLRYLGTEVGNQYVSGETFLTNPNNFVKTTYDFANRQLVAYNSNTCANIEDSSMCAVSGASIITSGIKAATPALNSYKTTNLITPAMNFYYYPIVLKVDESSAISDGELNIDNIYVDIYLPDYMFIIDNNGTENEIAPISVEDITLENIYAKFGLGNPVADANYKVYHYIIAESALSDFYVYVDIDQVNTPTTIEPELFTSVDYVATKYVEGEDEQLHAVSFSPISSDFERMSKIRVILHNASTVITRGTTLPKYIERNGSYTFSMFAYNHSETLVADGYTYPTADLYYVLPYNGDIADENRTSKVGSTKYKVNFTEESITGIANRDDYKFYYATTGVPTNIITDEISTTTDPSSIWNLWENPTEPVSNVIAIKIVKQTPFAPGDYFANANGLIVNVETNGSSDGNIFYNTFSLLTTKPANYDCSSVIDPEYEDDDSDSSDCEEAMNTKDNFSPTPTATSIYSREISGFVFEDSDYNGIFTSEESKMENIAVSLYKIDTLPESFDENDPSTYVKDTDKIIGSTLTGINGNFYFEGLAPGYYYVRFTFDNDKYYLTDFGKTSDYIPDSINNNSKALLLPSSNKAVSKIITFTDDYTSGNNVVTGINMGLAVKKEMAVQLNKFITKVTVNKDGKYTTYDYSDQNLSQVSITVLNTRNTKIQVEYAFSIENTRYFPGYVGLIVDSIPKDMTFNPDIEENKNWAIYDNTLYYNGLSGKLLLPNEKQYFKLVLDLDLKEAGTYRNVVTAKDLTIMGDDLPIYDFGSSNTLGGE